jgi:hypothetical protein
VQRVAVVTQTARSPIHETENTMTRNTITWHDGFGGTKWAEINGHKVTELSAHGTNVAPLYVVETLRGDGLPDLDSARTFPTLAEACAETGQHLCPCGRLLVPGCAPDLDAPNNCPTTTRKRSRA